MNIHTHHSDTLSPIVEVFKTNVNSEQMADRIRESLVTRWPDLKINFDLFDCDKILRVESSESCIDVESIAGLVEAFGYTIETLT